MAVKVNYRKPRKRDHPWRQAWASVPKTERDYNEWLHESRVIHRKYVKTLKADNWRQYGSI